MVYGIFTMSRFNRDNKRGGGGFRKRSFGGRDSRPTMHDAVCSECGKQCQVPFRPTGERPIYCNDCFRKERNGDRRESGGPYADPYKGQFEAIGAKLDKILDMLTPKIPEIPDAPLEKKPAKKRKKLISNKHSMKKFIVLYMMPAAAMEEMMKNSTPEEQKAEMAEWVEWAKSHKEIVDLGAPLGRNKRVSSKGVSDERNDVGGYSFIEAESQDAAAALFADSPHLKMPGAYVEVMECMQMPGM